MSASLNKVHLIGNLGADPEMRSTASGVPVANINLATSYRTAGGDDLTEWHRVVLFQGMAETASKYLKKGALVYVEGRLQTRKWTDKDGIERYSTEVVADTMQMLGSRKSDDAEAAGSGSGEPAHQSEAAGKIAKAPPKAAAGKGAKATSQVPVEDEEVPY